MGHTINLDEYAEVGTHWIALFCNQNETLYFDIFGVGHVPKEVKEFVGNKNIKTYIFQVQANNSVMYGYMLAGKNWLIFRTCFLLLTLRKMMI